MEEFSCGQCGQLSLEEVDGTTYHLTGDMPVDVDRDQDRDHAPVVVR